MTEFEAVVRQLTQSGWLPIVAGSVYLVVRHLLRGFLPRGYYFKFMDRYIRRADGDPEDDG